MAQVEEYMARAQRGESGDLVARSSFSLIPFQSVGLWPVPISRFRFPPLQVRVGLAGLRAYF